MIISKQIQSLVSEMVQHYSKCSHMEGRNITISDLPLHASSKLAAQIYATNPDLLAEATSHDNTWYESHMMPALISYLKNTSDHETEYEFKKQWEWGTTMYLYSIMNNLLKDDLFNHYEAA